MMQREHKILIKSSLHISSQPTNRLRGRLSLQDIYHFKYSGVSSKLNLHGYLKLSLNIIGVVTDKLKIILIE